MNFTFPFFIVAALLLVGLLLFALRPPKIRFSSVDEVFEALTAPRDYYQLPQIVQALQTNDTEFLAELGYPALRRRIRAERKNIALRYITCIETDYTRLIEASRVLSAMAPEVVAAEEWERIRLSVGFSWKCRLLRWRLRTGLRPWGGFAQISEMACELSYRLEQATSRIGERAAQASEFTSFLEERGGKPR